MTTIKTAWLYSAIIASLCGGAGVGYFAGPSMTDVERSIRQAQETALRECDSSRNHVFNRADVANSRAKGY